MRARERKREGVMVQIMHTAVWSLYVNVIAVVAAAAAAAAALWRSMMMMMMDRFKNK